MTEKRKKAWAELLAEAQANSKVIREERERLGLKLVRRIDWSCLDCGTIAGSDYMVRDDVWRRAFPDYAEAREAGHSVLCCLKCLQLRIGRRLALWDFTPAPINDGIRFAYELGGEVASRAAIRANSIVPSMFGASGTVGSGCCNGTPGCGGSGEKHACEALHVSSYGPVPGLQPRPAADWELLVADLRSKLKDAEREAYEVGEHVKGLLTTKERQKKAIEQMRSTLEAVYSEARDLRDELVARRVAHGQGRIAAIIDYVSASLGKGSYAKRKAAKR